MHRETFPTLVRGVKLAVTVNDGRVSFSAHSKLDTIAYDSGFQVGIGHFAGNTYYITTGGGQFLVKGEVSGRIAAFLRTKGVKVVHHSYTKIINGKKATHVIVDEIYPVTTSASEAVAAAADSTDD